MDLSEITAFAEAQDQGAWHELLHPVDGKRIGISLKVVGPDSEVARKVSLSLQAAAARLQDRHGRIDPAQAEEVSIDHVARLVIDWNATEDGEPVPFTHAAMVRLLKSGQWIKNQLGGFAATRAPFAVLEVMH